MPVFNTDAKWLEAAIESSTNQLYPNWELCIADDCSTKSETKQTLLAYRNNREKPTADDKVLTSWNALLMKGFVDAWYDYFQRARQQGGFAALRCFETVIRLLQYCEARRPAPSEMTDDEIERELMAITQRMIQQHPEFGLAVKNQNRKDVPN